MMKKKLILLLFIATTLLSINAQYQKGDNLKADSLFKRMALDLSVSTSGRSRQLLISNTIDSLEKYNLTGVDIRYFMKSHDVQASVLNWASDSFNIKLGDGYNPLFYVDSGWVNNEDKSHLTTNYNTLNNGNYYTLNNASWTVGIADRGSVLNRNSWGTDENGQQTSLTFLASGDNYYYVNGIIKQITPPDTIGIYTASVTGGNSTKYYHNGDSINYSAASVTGLSQYDISILNINNDGVHGSSGYFTVNYLDMSKNITTNEAVKLYDIINYYNSNLNELAGLEADLYIMDGQSNMNGVTDIPDTLNEDLFCAEIYDSTFKKLRYISGDGGMTSQPAVQIKMNPVYSISRKADSALKKIFIANWAKNGSFLFQTSGEEDWNINSTGELYDKYITSIDSCISKMNQRGINVKNIYRICFQGESDATMQAAAESWESNQLDLINAINTHLTGYNIEHYLIEIVDNKTYSSTVNSAMHDIANARDDVSIIDNSGFVYPDNTHLDINSQLLLGEKIYSKTIGKINNYIIMDANSIIEQNGFIVKITE